MLYKQNGTVILLALLVMTGMITIGLATATLVLNEIQQSSQLDKSMVAFYAAESAVEKGIYQVRKQEFVTGEEEKILPNNASYLMITDDAEDYLVTNLLKDQTLQLDLYIPGSLLPLDSPVKSLGFSWSDDPGSWLEVRWVAWTTLGVLNPEVTGAERGKKIPPGDDQIINLDVNDYLYKVRITARYADVSNLEIVAYDQVNPNPTDCGTPGPGSDCQTPIPGRIKIKGLGEYPNNSPSAAKQAILVTLPQISPLSGLYDYVIFSEDPVVKEN